MVQDINVVTGSRLLTAEQFQRLAEVPPEAQWFANLASTQTRRAYQSDLKAFMAFTGINQPEEFRSVTRGHVLAWRADLETQGLPWRIWAAPHKFGRCFPDSSNTSTNQGPVNDEK